MFLCSILSSVLFLVLMSESHICSQELLAAVEKERRSRSRNTSVVAAPTIHYFQEDEDSDHVSVLA